MGDKTTLVDRIANDGFLRIKLNYLQKQVIRMAERQKLWLYQCKSCNDQPFFVGGSKSLHESANSCKWCGETTAPHKHQCDDEETVNL